MSEIWHFGILGMKWGVRRYQNKYGSLTPAGKKRYGWATKNNIDPKSVVEMLSNADRVDDVVGDFDEYISGRKGSKSISAILDVDSKRDTFLMTAGGRDQKQISDALKTFDQARDEAYRDAVSDYLEKAGFDKDFLKSDDMKPTMEHLNAAFKRGIDKTINNEYGNQGANSPREKKLIDAFDSLSESDALKTAKRIMNTKSDYAGITSKSFKNFFTKHGKDSDPTMYSKQRLQYLGAVLMDYLGHDVTNPFIEKMAERFDSFGLLTPEAIIAAASKYK